MDYLYSFVLEIICYKVEKIIKSLLIQNKRCIHSTSEKEVMTILVECVDCQMTVQD
jgi:hypothetical protein